MPDEPTNYTVFRGIIMAIRHKNQLVLRRRSGGVSVIAANTAVHKHSFPAVSHCLRPT